MKPTIFIGSSTEGLEVARAIEKQLQYDAEPTVWTDGIFGLGHGTLESLVGSLDRFDFAVLVLSPDDLIVSREQTNNSPRDNVLLEIGLFIGRLGRERTFIVFNRDGNLKLPSDLAGVTMATYGNRQDQNVIAALGPACTDIKYAIKTHGTREQRGNSPNNSGNFLSSMKPIVVARVTTHASGNVSTALDLVVHNTGGSPAKNVRLTVEKDDLQAVFSEEIDEKWKKNIEQCFSDNGLIPVLENGHFAVVTNSFGALSPNPKPQLGK
jgi:hypothetical protein